LNHQIRIALFDHLVERSEKLQIILEGMSIQLEHVHLLLALPLDKPIAQVAKGLKGESSNWINNKDFISGKFRWQRGYGAFSVSASQLSKVKRYIKNQNEHHVRKSFKEEYDDWARQYGIMDE
jgi:REP element-mobilizing transposase RayT